MENQLFNAVLKNNSKEFISKIDEYKKIQKIAKNVLDEIRNFINPDKTEKDIVEECNLLLKKYEIEETWYYNCAALVLLGSRSCFSVSGKDYEPSSEKVGKENLITIDLSPMIFVNKTIRFRTLQPSI